MSLEVTQNSKLVKIHNRVVNISDITDAYRTEYVENYEVIENIISKLESYLRYYKGDGTQDEQWIANLDTVLIKLYRDKRGSDSITPGLKDLITKVIIKLDPSRYARESLLGRSPHARSRTLLHRNIIPWIKTWENRKR